MMIRFLIIAVTTLFSFISCDDTENIDFKSNISAEDFNKGHRNIQNVEVMDVSKLDFAIEYQALGSGKNSPNCEILITRKKDQYFMRTIEMSRSRAFSKTYTHKIVERVLDESEVGMILSKLKECEFLPVYISSRNPCMHDTYFTIKLKNKNNYWETNWCSVGSFKYSKEDADYKAKGQEFENLLLDIAQVTPTKKMYVVTEIENNDSLKMQSFVTYGLRCLNVEYKLDNKPVKANENGVWKMKMHPQDTVNWKNRLEVYEVRKDRSVHLVSEE